MLNISPWNLLFVVINLLVLLILMKKFLYKPVLGVIAKRQELLAGQFAQAEKSQKEAQELKNMSKSRIEDTLREHLTAIRTEREAAEAAEESAAEAALDESFSLKAFYEEYFGGDDV